MPPPKLLISDVDGCLTPEDSTPFDPDLFHHLTQRLRALSPPRGNTPLLLCTGRPQPYVEALLKILGLHTPAIAENGAVVYTLDGNHAAYGPGVTPAKIEGLRAVRAHLEHHLLPRHPGTLIQFGKEAHLSVYSTDAAALKEAAEMAGRFVETQALPPLDIRPTHFYLNLSMHGVDKGTALDAILQQFGVPREAIAGVGDTTGDLAIRERCGRFACPANAQEEIRAIADYVAPREATAGFLNILDWLGFD